MNVIFVSNEKIALNPFQKNIGFDTEKVQDIKESIKQGRENGTKGIQQVCKARKVGDTYELLFGRHRLEAFKELVAEGDSFFNEFPLLVCEASDQEMFEAMGIENLSRRDISIVEAGETFHDYMEKFGVTSVETAKAFGKTDEYVRSALRMLRLPSTAQEKLIAGEITVTTGRDLLVVEKLLGEVGVEEALSDMEDGIETPSDVIEGVLRSSPKVVAISMQTGWASVKKYPAKYLPELTRKDLVQAIEGQYAKEVPEFFRKAFAGYQVSFDNARTFLKGNIYIPDDERDGLIEKYDQTLSQLQSPPRIVNLS